MTNIFADDYGIRGWVVSAAFGLFVAGIISLGMWAAMQPSTGQQPAIIPIYMYGTGYHPAYSPAYSGGSSVRYALAPVEEEPAEEPVDDPVGDDR